MTLSVESLAKIDREIAKYPADQKQSAVMSALRIAQQEKGWLASDTIQFVADYLGMPHIAAYEVATFYNMYDTQQRGKHKLVICTNLPCRVTWQLDVGEYLKQKLEINYGETTEDGKFTLIEGECMGACGDAPVMIVNNHRMCSFMTPEKVDQLLAELE
ncbi:MAG: NADH-quinone oxidoreductase subunit NuoE [Pseudomonadota bacterium]